MTLFFVLYLKPGKKPRPKLDIDTVRDSFEVSCQSAERKMIKNLIFLSHKVFLYVMPIPDFFQMCARMSEELTLVF